MSAESEIVAKWDATPALLAAIPSSRIFLGVVPEQNAATPYAVFVWAETSYEWTSCYRIETFPFMISIFDTSAANTKVIGALVDAAYEFEQLSDTTIECRPIGKQLSAEPVLVNVAGEGVYSYSLRYELKSVRDL